jgi:hypothetical protein
MAAMLVIGLSISTTCLDLYKHSVLPTSIFADSFAISFSSCEAVSELRTVVGISTIEVKEGYF